MPRCVAEIARSAADVVCLQEVDLRLHASLSNALKKAGYACLPVQPRCRGVIASFGVSSSKFKVSERMQDGAMIAYKTSALSLIESWPEHLCASTPHGDQPDGCAAAAASFRHEATGKVFAIASLHLRPAADAVRCSAMVHMKTRMQDRVVEKCGNVDAVFLCGDFNGFPGAVGSLLCSLLQQCDARCVGG